MATVINVPKDTRFEGFGKGAADFLTEFQKKRDERKRQAAIQNALGTLDDDSSEDDIAKALAPFMDPGDIADMLVKSRSVGARKAPRRITVFGPNNTSKEIEVPFESPSITNVQQLGAVAPGADLTGFSLTKPETASRMNIRGRKITDLVKQGVDRARAVRLVDKFERIEIVPASGFARLVNETTVPPTVTEIPLGQLSDLERSLAATVDEDGAPVTIQTAQDILDEGAAPQATLWDLAVNGTGLWSTIRSGLSRGVGLIPFSQSIPVAEDTINARQGLRLASGELARSMSSVVTGTRAVQEIQNIREEMDFEPGIFDSSQALQARMVAVERSFQQKIRIFKERAEDPNKPEKFRREFGSLGDVLEAFLPTLGVPRNAQVQSPEDVVPEVSAKFGRFAGMTRQELIAVDPQQIPVEERVFLREAYRQLGFIE